VRPRRRAARVGHGNGGTGRVRMMHCIRVYE
jgi:hypothetical protein